MAIRRQVRAEESSLGTNKSGEKFSIWYTEHRRLVLGVVGFLVVIAVVGTLLWQRPTIAEKFSDDYFREDAMTDENDPDNDGLSNEEEERYGTDPEVRDSDGDGLKDGEEVHSYKTDPNKTDTDSDGYPDQMEIYTGHDPNQAPGDIETQTSLDERMSSYEDAGLGSVDSLLNGEASAEEMMSLEDFGVGDFNDLATLYGSGHTSEEITILDSDLSILEIPEDQARPLLDQYVQDITLAALEVFDGDTDAASSTVMDFRMGMTGQFNMLHRPIESTAVFTDKLLEVDVPLPAVEMHKKFMETLMLSESLMRGLQRLEIGDSMEPMSLLAQMNRIEQVGLEAERELDSLSKQYELNIASDFFSAEPAFDVGEYMELDTE